MTDRAHELAVLSRGLEQVERLLGRVSEENRSRPTPCHDWDVADLADHLVAGTATFARAVSGEQVDWSASPAQVEGDHATEFRKNADDLRAAWDAAADDGGQPGPDWQAAELAVHSYDLATALGQPTDELDVEVAERGLAFMQANLKPEMRSTAFDPEQPAPSGADAYQRIAAFAGRRC